MDCCVNACCNGNTAIQDAARRHLDALVTNPRCSDNTLEGDIADLRYRIRLLEAMNGIDFAEFRKISYPCMMCSALPEDDAELVTTLIRGTKAKLQKMEIIAIRIRDRKDTIKNLKNHSEILSCAKRFLDIVLRDHGIQYSYRVNPDDSVHFVVQTTEENDDRSQHRARTPETPDLIDLSVLPPITAPVLQLWPPYSPAALIPSTPIEEQTPKNTTATSKASPKPPVLQIWDSEEERINCIRDHASTQRDFKPDSIPLVFHHGIQYTPPYPFPDQSRMVIFTNVPPDTTCSDLLSFVRGGPVLCIARATASTFLVHFVRGRDARAYVEYASSRVPSPFRVALAQTPSYPVREALLRDILQRGVTRYLAFPRCHAENDDDDDAAAAAAAGSRQAAFLALECGWGWVETLACPQTTTTTSGAQDMFCVSFRNVVFAQRAYGLVRAQFPRCGVYYYPDPCAGPLSELGAL
ncbi:hypothetical protein GGS24DRAFT_514689 [Hypoxylon argillaceum]|nr:hypothetical protein GGS24DRAFT_514689 [Hypoxylon argillaceum]